MTLSPSTADGCTKAKGLIVLAMAYVFFKLRNEAGARPVPEAARRAGRAPGIRISFQDSQS